MAGSTEDETGWGRNAPIDWGLEDLVDHHRRHLAALLSVAREHDEQRRIERELEELDAAIEAGVHTLPEAEKRVLAERCKRDERP